MRYQIIIKPRQKLENDPRKWSFIAHGARYDKADAMETRLRYEQRGFAVKLLPCDG